MTLDQAVPGVVEVVAGGLRIHGITVRRVGITFPRTTNSKKKKLLPAKTTRENGSTSPS